MNIKELPELERPYEKLEMYGAERLSMAELIAIIIKSGTKNLTSIDIAQDLLKEDINNRGVTFLKDFSIEELSKKKGIGRVKAIQLKAIAELAIRANKPVKVLKTKILTPEDIARVVMPEMRFEKQEIMKTILLNIKNEIIKVVTNSVGGMNSNVIEVPEIFKEPIRSSASKIVLVHNHPSGNPEPSDSDIKFTKRMANAGEMFGIEVVDHIIIGDGTFFSLKRMKIF